MESFLEGQIETCINEINLMRKQVLGSKECSVCGQTDGKGKKVKCGLCGVV